MLMGLLMILNSVIFSGSVYAADDTTNPTVSMSLSPNKAIYESGDSIKVTVRYSDNSGVSTIEFLHDGDVVKTEKISGTSGTKTYTVKAIEGGAELQAVVTDESGNEGTRKIKYNCIAAEEPEETEEDPEVTSISFSPNKSTYKVGESIKVTVKLKDDVKLSKYEIYHNGKVAKTESISGTSKTVTVSVNAIEGDIPIKVIVHDAAGNTATETKEYFAEKEEVEKDTEPPKITSISFNKTKYETGDDVKVTVKFSDNKDLAEYEIYNAGTLEKSGNISGKSDSITATFTAKTGNNAVKVVVWDEYGNSSYDSKSYTAAVVENEPPEASITLSPNRTTYEEGESIKITAKLSDDTKLAKYEIYHAGKLVKNGSSSSKSTSVTANVDALVGNNQIKVIVWDAAGLTSTETITYSCKEVVNEAPEASISLPSNKTTYETGETIKITVKLTDDIKLSKYEIYHAGELVKDGNTSGKSYTATVNVEALSGNTQIKAIVWDDSGLTSTDTINYTGTAVVNQSPTATITLSPNQTKFEEGETIKITAKLSDDKGLSKYEIYHNGTLEKDGKTSSKSTSQTVSVKAVSGNGQIKVVVWDSNNAQTTEIKTYTGTMKDDDPEAELSIVAKKSKYEEGENVQVKVDFTDDIGLSKYRIDHGNTIGNEMFLSGKTATYNFTYKAVPGNTKIKVTVWDTAGNSSSETVTYNCSAPDEPPVLDFSYSPIKYTYNEGETIKVVAEFEDDVKLSKYEVHNGGKIVKSGKLSGKSDKITVNVDAVAGNDVVLKVVVIDSNDSSYSKSITYDCIEVDNKPTISSTKLSPEKSIYRYGEKITVKATLKDDKGLSKYVIKHNGSYMYSEYISGKSYTISYNGIYAWDGYNDITIEAYDSNNQVSSIDLDYEGTDEYGDPPVAKISFSPYGPYTEGETVTVYVDFTDDYGLKEYEATRNNKRVSGGALSGKEDSVSFKIAAVEGDNEIEIEVIDKEGNSVSFSDSFRAEEDKTNAAPTVQVSGLSSKYIVGETIVMTLIMSDDKGLSEYVVENGYTTVSSGTLSGKSRTVTCKFIAKEGNNTIKITVTDEDDKDTVVTRSYTGENDNTAPKVSIMNMGASYNEGDRVTIKANFSDNAALSRYEFYHDGTLLNSGVFSENSINTSIDFSFTAMKNSHTIQIMVWDKNNNQSFAKKTYIGATKDQESPTVNVVGIEPRYEVDETVGFTMSFSDNEGLSKYEILVDNVIVKQNNLYGMTATEQYSFAAAEGRHQIVVRVYDHKNNKSDFTTEYLGETDNVKPVITISGYENYYKIGDTVRYTVYFSDNKMLGHYEVIYNESGETIASGELTGISDVIELSFTALEGQSIKYSIKVWDEKGNLGIRDDLWYTGSSGGSKPPRPKDDEEMPTIGNPINNSGGMQVSVYIPEFRIYINGDKTNQKTAQYPYIVYNGITYFPMTYHGARFLGLKTDWTFEHGLKVAMNSVASEGQNEKTQAAARNDAEYYTATTVSGYINVMGKYINNDQEVYPLIIFREVTYFPLTWRFCVDEFGWDYSYTNESGLKINSI